LAQARINRTDDTEETKLGEKDVGGVGSLGEQSEVRIRQLKGPIEGEPREPWPVVNW